MFFLYDFYLKYFTWLSQLTRMDRFLPWGAEESLLNSVPIQILKLLLELPFFLIVLWIPVLYSIRMLVWMFGCWMGCADNIYKD